MKPDSACAAPKTKGRKMKMVMMKKKSTPSKQHQTGKSKRGLGTKLGTPKTVGNNLSNQISQ
jgi:hypothetical protein